MIDGLKRKLLISLVLGLIVVSVVAFLGDFPKISAALRRFEWSFIPMVLGFALWNYLLRFVKWHFYIRLIGVRQIRKRDSLLMFLSGLSMVMTPGKVGEWLKCVLLRESAGTPLSASAPIPIAERVTDGLSMLLLASGGLLLYGYGWQVLVVFLVICLALIVVCQNRPLVERMFTLGERLPLISRRISYLRAFHESSYQLLRYRNIVLATALGILSWGGECLAFYFVLVGLGIPASPVLLLQAAFVLEASTLIGSLSMIPGGLAVSEGSITGLLLFLGITSEPSLAAAATLLIRFCTLWFAVSVGIVALSLYTRRSGSKELATPLMSPKAG